MCKETVIKNKQFKETKQAYLIHTWADKAIKVAVVNRTMSALHREGYLKLLYTVPWNIQFSFFLFFIAVHEVHAVHQKYKYVKVNNDFVLFSR